MTIETKSVADVLGIKAGEILRVDPEVQDDELQAAGGLFMLVGALERRAPLPGSNMKAMEVWHGVCELTPGGPWIARTIRGRSHLSKCLTGQVGAHGMGFLNVHTGEPALAPSAEGAWNLISRATLEPWLLCAYMRIDPTKGRAAGKGQRFTYLVNAAARPLKIAAELIPALPLDERSALALGLDDSDQESE